MPVATAAIAEQVVFIELTEDERGLYDLVRPAVLTRSFCDVVVADVNDCYSGHVQTTASTASLLVVRSA